MSGFIRWFIAIPFAALVTAALFLLILNSIAPRPFIYRSADDPEKIVFFDFVDCHCPPWLPISIRLPVSPDEADSSNSWTRSDKAVTEAPRVPEEKPVTPKMPERIDGFETGLHYCSGRAPLLDFFAPEFPKACKEKRAGGAVVAKFDITAEGHVVNVSIVDSADRCFDRAVMKSVSRRRYPPMCNSEGKPVARYSQQEVFRFEFND